MKRERRTRAFTRVPFGGRIELWKYRSATPVRAGDLSAGGVFLRTREEVAEGSYVTIRIPLPGHRPFSALCQVVRTQAGRDALTPRGIALNFVDIAPKDRAKLTRYVMERSAHAPRATL